MDVTPILVPIVERPNEFSQFLEQLCLVEEPDKVTVAFVESLGYKSKAHRSFVAALRDAGFIDDLGVPTTLYRDLMVQDSAARQRIGASLARVYAEVIRHAGTQTTVSLNDFVAVCGLSRSMGQLAMETYEVVWSYGELSPERDEAAISAGADMIHVRLDNGVVVMFPATMTMELARGRFAAGLHLLESVTG